MRGNRTALAFLRCAREPAMGGKLFSGAAAAGGVAAARQGCSSGALPARRERERLPFCGSEVPTCTQKSGIQAALGSARSLTLKE